MPSSTRRPAPRAGISRASIRGVLSPRGRDRAALASREMIVAATDKVALRGGSALEVLRIFLRLGLTSFGGPVAHLGYFRAEFVERRRWLDEPAFAYGVTELGDLSQAAWLHGLKIVAVAVVAQAVWGMARNLCPDRERATIAVGAAMVALAMPSAPGQIGAIAAGGLIGWGLLRGAPQPRQQDSLAVHLPRAWSAAALVIFFTLLIGLPVLATAFSSHTVALVDAFYRSGALVFGGGHVVLPLLQAEVVPPGWVTNDAL